MDFWSRVEIFYTKVAGLCLYHNTSFNFKKVHNNVELFRPEGQKPGFGHVFSKKGYKSFSNNISSD